MARPKSTSVTRSAMITARIPPATKAAIDILSKHHGLSMSQLLEKAVKAMCDSQDWEIRFTDPKTDYEYDVIKESAGSEPWLRSLKLSLMAPECLAAPEVRFWKNVQSDGRNFHKPDLKAMPHDEQRRYSRPILFNFGVPNDASIAKLYDDFLELEKEKAKSE